MFKKLLIGVAAVAVLLGVNASANTPKAEAAVNYTYFCHQTNSATNPYSSVPFSQTYSEIDGEGNNDHTLHTGPVVTSEAQAQALKDAKISWGDIIPPVPGVLPDGYNWTAAGQAVYNAGCDFPEDQEEQPANIQYSVTCNATNDMIVVTVVNIGDATGSITVNEEQIEVAGGATVTREFTVGTKIVITLDGQEEPDYEAFPVCPNGGEGGSGGGSTPVVTPAEVTELPGTSGVNYALILTSAAALAVAGSLVGTRLYRRFF